MTSLQKVVKYCAIAFAVILIVNIFLGIFSAVGVIVGFSEWGDDKLLDEMKTYEVAETVKDITINVNASKVAIKQSEKFCVKSNLSDLSVNVKDGKLKVNEKSKFLWFGHNGGHGVVEIYIPTEFKFGKVDIDAGAGDLDIEYLAADSVHLDLGAGKITINKLFVTIAADINAGAGELVVQGGEVNNLDLDLGAGQANVTLKLTGLGDIDSGVGNTDITLLGGKETYRVNVKKGIGSIKVDGKNVSDGESIGTGSSVVKIDGVVGKISVDFLEQ